MEVDGILESDEAILNTLSEGRATPAYLVERTGYSKQTVHNRLNTLTAAEHVRKVTDGLYEIINDPRQFTQSQNNGDNTKRCFRPGKVDSFLYRTASIDLDSKLIEAYREFLEERPPEKAHQKEAIIDALRYLRVQPTNKVSSREICDSIYPKYEYEYSSKQLFWKSIRQWLKKYPGFKSVGYRMWRFEGNEMAQSRLKRRVDGRAPILLIGNPVDY
jgi:hypothetical protein